MVDRENVSTMDEMWEFMEMLSEGESIFKESNGDILSAVDLELCNEWGALCRAFRAFAAKAEEARSEIEDDEDEFEFGKHIFSDFD